MERHKKQIRTYVDKKYQTTYRINKCKENQDKIFKRWNTKTNQKENAETKKFKNHSTSQKTKPIKIKKNRTCSKKSKKPIPAIFSSTPLQGSYINVSVLGKTINTLVDTGSNLSCIQKSLLDSLDQDFISYGTSEYEKVRGIGGHLINILGTAILPLKIGDCIFYQKFYIFDKILHPLLLGIDFLKMHKCTLNFETKSLDTDSGTPVINLLSKVQHDTGLARPVRRTVIQPQSETVIPIKISRLPNKETTLFEPMGLLTRKKLAGAKAVLIVNNGRGLCRILNPLPTPVTLGPSNVIGKLSPIDIESIQELDTEQQNVDVCAQGAACSEPVKSEQTENSNYKDIVDDLGISLNESDLSENEKLRLYEFIAKNRSTFAKDTSELVGSNVHKHKIITGQAPPQHKRPYRVSPQIKQLMDEQIDDMLENDIIEPSSSYWAAPVVMCKKKDGSYRFAVDYRDLNAVTEPINFPLPKLEDVIDSVGENHSKVFTVLDLRAGFHQILLDEETRHKTTFITHRGCYSFKRLPYGLRNAPIAFQSLMSKVLNEINFKYALVYIDDILIHSANFEEHLVHLQAVFDRLNEANLKLQPKKSQFAARQVEYLGHHFSKQGIQVNQSKISAVQSYPVPKTRKQLKAFLGLACYYRRFVKGFSDIATPLHRLLRKDTDFNWSQSCDDAFNLLKQKLTSSPILAFPDMQKPFFLSVDASGSAIGFILGQHDAEEREVVISYGGRSLRGTEVKWSICERECLALVEAIKQFHPYLSHNHFTVYSDNIALKWLQKIKDQNGRLGRWSIKLQGYHFTVIHKAGVRNQNADALSRRPYPEQEGSSKEPSQPSSDQLAQSPSESTLTPPDISVTKEDPHILALQQLPTENEEPSVKPSRTPEVNAKSNTEMSSLQASCEEIGAMYRYMKVGQLPENLVEQRKIIISSEQYIISDGILYHFLDTKTKKNKRLPESFSQLVVPKCLREDVIVSYHDGNAHLGFDKTYAAIRSKYYWPKMYADIDVHVRTCHTCQRSKRNYGNNKAPLTPMPVAARPFSRLHMDVLGPLPSTSEKYKYILLVICAFTGWCECFPIRSQEATVVAEILYAEIFCRYGAPDILISDRAKNFMSKLVSALCELFQVTKHHTSSFHPQTNSMAERTFSSLSRAIRSYCNVEQTNWHKQLPAIMMAFRNAESATTGYTPYELVFGCKMRTPLDTALIPSESLTKSAQEYMQELVDSLKLTHLLVKSNRLAAQARQKKQYDRTAKKPTFHLGQQVMMRKENVTPGLTKKFAPKFDGPYYITKVCPNHTFRLRRQSNHKPIRSRVHANRLKRYFNPALRKYANTLNAQQQQRVRLTAQNDETQDYEPTVQRQEIEPNVRIQENEINVKSQENEPNVEQGLEDNSYVVDKILASAFYRGEKIYKVKWVGKKGTTWERKETVPQNLINQFHINHTATGRKRKRPHKYFVKTQASNKQGGTPVQAALTKS